MNKLALIAWLAASCTTGSSAGPVEVKYDRDTCARCSMVISDQAFATEVRGPTGQVVKFDDLGCALGWLEQQPFKDDPATQIWVTGAAGEWVDAKTARYSAGKTTPMAYGFGPSASGGLQLDQVRAQLKAKQEGR